MSSSNTRRQLAETGQIAWGGAGVGPFGPRGVRGSTSPTVVNAATQRRAVRRLQGFATSLAGPSPALPTTAMVRFGRSLLDCNAHLPFAFVPRIDYSRCSRPNPHCRGEGAPQDDG